jgi:hypothetical protein
VPQCGEFRLETRARELTVMASLRVRSPEAKGNRFSVTPQGAWEEVLMGLEVMAV